MFSIPGRQGFVVGFLLGVLIGCFPNFFTVFNRILGRRGLHPRFFREVHSILCDKPQIQCQKLVKKLTKFMTERVRSPSKQEKFQRKRVHQFRFRFTQMSLPPDAERLSTQIHHNLSHNFT